MNSRQRASTDIVKEIIERLAIDLPRRGKWRRCARDAARVVSHDYEATVAKFVAEGSLPIAAMQACARRKLPEFGFRPLDFAETMARVRDPSAGLGVKVLVSPYGEPGHPLRGFYVAEDNRRPLIWVNRQHTPTAMGATFAHELGHHFWRELFPEEVLQNADERPRVLQHDGFAEHLLDSRELFADAFAALAGYPTEIARRLFAQRRWDQPILDAQRILAVMNGVEMHIHRHYPGDLGPDSGLSAGRRLYYFGSMMHFSKVRAAVLRVTGV